MFIVITFLLQWLIALHLPLSLMPTNSVKIDDFVLAFENLNTRSISLSTINYIPFESKGGHLQGIQLYKENTIYLSGSSEELSYIVKINLEGQSKVMAIDTLMHSPLRHAGGFQIFEHYLAVGIEDNKKRNLAYLQIYDLESQAPFDQPIYTIERKGDFERVTAGAVGITAFRGDILILVANWDSRVLDFYSCPQQDFYDGKGLFTLKNSIEVKKQSTDEWSDPKWESYQNLNLFSDKSQQLFMVGTAKNKDGKQIADLFELQLEPATHKVKKLSSKVFNTSKGVDFKAAAGLNISDSGTLILAAAPYQLERNTNIDLFTNNSTKFSTWEKMQAWASPDARQAAAANEHYIYAINNHTISKYERATGNLIVTKNLPNTKHLNSGFFYKDLLYCAHSNYPNQPDSSSIRIIDPENLILAKTINLGESEGSLTWIVKNKEHWYALFAYYGKDNHLTYLAKMNNNWEIIGKWTFPKKMIEEMGKMSISGGVPWKEGFLVTGHDEKKLYYLILPKTGKTLNFIEKYKAPFTGQGIALDPLNGGLVGINRAENTLISSQLMP
ncbi:hypothetical protein [uncultured Cyclobacterium sp.]|uniref:hypothetical protein n=1 Tax=uncultured Cyclobacterium sp. TaxID=453820 RepID=UPI0030EC5B50